MASSPVRIEVERDPKDNLRFYATFPDSDLAKLSVRSLNLDIADAEKLLKDVRKRRATDGGKIVMNGQIGKWLKTNAASNATAKEHSISRKKAGTTPAHWRVGLVITFANAALAQAFAAACSIP